MAVKMEEYIHEIRKRRRHSGRYELVFIQNVPVGLGEPVFDIHAELGKGYALHKYS
jgi:chorismate synthase